MARIPISFMAALALLGAVGFAKSADAACGKVTIAEMNWDSARVAAHVQDIILAQGYGCETEVVPGDTVPTVTSMTEKNEPDIAPEIWINSAREVVEAAVAEGRLAIAGEILSDGGEEGWWVPDYVVKDNPDLTTLQAVLQKPDLFPDKEEPGKGRFYTCPSGWGLRDHQRQSLQGLRPGGSRLHALQPRFRRGTVGGDCRRLRARTADLHLLLGTYVGARQVPDGQAGRDDP